MNVLHFVDNFAQPTETFIRRYVQKSREFSRSGLVAFNLINITDELKNNLQLFGIRNRLYTRKSAAGMLRFAGEYLSGVKKWHHELNEIVTDFKPDIIHCHFGLMGIQWMDFERKFNTGIPFVTSFYGYDASSLPFTDRAYKLKLDKLWYQGTAFFAEGPELALKLNKLGCPQQKALVNPLLIPTDDYPVKTTYRQPADPVKFLFIGRFVEKKGFHQFLAAVGNLRKELPPFTIDIIGGGPYQPVYEKLITQYELTDNINWLGMKKHEEIIGSLKNYDFFVHPSLTAADNDSEGGAPTIIIEAQTAGLPVIASDHADIPYVMGYPDLLSKENDIPSLTGIIKKAVNCKNISELAGLGIAKVELQHNLNLSNIYKNNLETIIASYK